VLNIQSIIKYYFYYIVKFYKEESKVNDKSFNFTKETIEKLPRPIEKTVTYKDIAKVL